LKKYKNYSNENGVNDFDLKIKALIRVDFNVPLDEKF
jgi:3-phosphoglycerate kinase